jgi:hypothetical protein
VVPVSAPTALRSDGSAELDTASARQITEATEALNAHPDVPVSLVPTPETVDGLEPAGHDDLESALAEAATGREVLASTYVPLDAASWNALDGPVTIGSQLDAGEDALTARLGVPADRSTGLLSPLVDPPALATLVDLGTERLVVPEPLLDPLDPSDFPVTMTQTFDVVDGAGRRVPAVQADAALEGHVRSTDQPALAANRTLADLGVLYFDLPLVARGAVLRIGPEDAAVLGPVLEGLAVAADAPPGASALLAPDTLPGLFEHMTRAPAPESEGEGEGEDDEVLVRGWVASGPRPLGDLPERRAEAVATIDAYRTMVGTDDDAVRRARRLVRVADDVRLGPEGTPGPQDYLDGATTVIGGRLGAIRAPEQGAVTLTASDASVPVAIDNGLDVPVRVQLHLRSEKLDFPDGSPIEVTLAPGPNRIEVHVRARASGVFPLEVSVTSLDGAIELSDARVRVRSAAVSGLGVVLSVGAGAFLCVWWARNWRKARRARSLVSPSHPALRTAGGGRSGDTRPRG